VLLESSVKSESSMASARLLADVGGTNARFAYQASPAEPLTQLRSLPVADFERIDVAAATYLNDLGASSGPTFQRPRAAAIAVATAVGGDAVRFTNSKWSFSQAALREALQLDRLAVLNDFEALALSLPCLTQHQLTWRGKAPLQDLAQGAMLAVVGPGTGLGVAGLKRAGADWFALPGEGGHATLAAHDALEAEACFCGKAALRRGLEFVALQPG
jgi:glucokinase